MIEINLKGGMGNQLFQYATARHLGLKHNKKLVLNLDYFTNTPKGDTPRQYQLNVFQIDPEIKLKNTVHPLARLLQKIMLRIFNEGWQYNVAIVLLKFNLPIYLNGYFQNEKYFKDSRNILLREFTLNKELGEEALRVKRLLEKSEGVCLNVRRGDYLKPCNVAIFGDFNMRYYTDALEYINNKVKNPLAFVFSDDSDWVKKEFKIDNVIFVSNDVLKDYEQMYLMSLCKHNIIANSSFAWWGAWLNQNPEKIVIAPKMWTTTRSSEEFVPTGWIKI